MPGIFVNQQRSDWIFDKTYGKGMSGCCLAQSGQCVSNKR
jgi:hypothetical protein